MDYKNACKILEIDPKNELTLEKLKKEYRLQALKYHPDKNNSVDSVAKFQSINESYEFLKNHIKYGFDYDIDLDLEEDDEKCENYQKILFQFIRNMADDETFKIILVSYLKDVLELALVNYDPREL